MLEDVEVSRSLMKRMKSTGEMTEPYQTAIDLSERKLPIQLMRV